MKFSLVAIASAFFAVATAFPTDNIDVRDVQAPQACANPANARPFYRAYNSAKVDHFYTLSQNEINTAIRSGGYVSEGISSYIFPNSQTGTVPLFRLYNPTVVDHFYTTSSTERNNAQRLGYNSEGIAGYIYPNANCGGVPLYRLYSASGTDHFYTTSASERDAATGVGYVSEGITGYVYPY
ncbi:hypothetical protein H0H93_001697 [Arthromyces matolae]|nr:hypothetical protein H0H93_001697 [Arthromyces matolae]